LIAVGVDINNEVSIAVGVKGQDIDVLVIDDVEALMGIKGNLISRQG